MARRCDLTDKSPMSGNNVSHSQRKTRRRFNVNIQKVTLFSDALQQKIRVKLAVSTLRTVDFKGGLDNYLIGTKNGKLSDYGLKLKRKVSKALAEK